jgi:hypothetical protein
MTKRERTWIKEMVLWTVMEKRDLNLRKIGTSDVLSRNLWLEESIEAKLFATDTTLSECGAFIEVAALGVGVDLKTVSLVHETFKKFVTDFDECRSIFYIQPEEANTWIAMTSTMYLAKQTIRYPEESTIPKSFQQMFDREHPLFSYDQPRFERRINDRK